MPRYTITFRKTISYTTELTLKAPNEEVAWERAEGFEADGPELSSLEWSLEDENIELETIDEEG